MIAFMVRYDRLGGERGYGIFRESDQAKEFLEDCNRDENIGATASYRWDGSVTWDWMPCDL